MLEPSSSEESDVDGDEMTPGYGGTSGVAGLDASVHRPGGRPLPVLGGRVAGFAGVGAFGFGHQTGLAGALNSSGSVASVSTSLSSTTSLTAASSAGSIIVPPNIDLLHQRSHSLCTTGIYA